MRLFDIIDHKDTEVTSPYHAKSQIKNLDPKTRLGDGAKAVVHQTDDPHMAKRYSKEINSTEFDKFDAYAKIITERKLWENPHFPRVYETEKEVVGHPDAGQVYTHWLIERLFTYKTVSFDDARTMVYNYFNEEFFKEVGLRTRQSLTAEEYFKRARETVSATGVSESLVVINDICEGVYPYKPHIYNERNDAFMDATRILNELHDENAMFGNDLMAANVMFRRGPGGVQIVFTDPF